MNAKELAQLLNGRQYTKELSRAEAKQAALDGLVVVYGASDDLMEFGGAIDDELGACDGTTAYLNSDGLLENDCVDDCPHFRQKRDKAATIDALWCKEEPYSWTFETDIPHETFIIVEEGSPDYCRGIVFALKDVVTK